MIITDLDFSGLLDLSKEMELLSKAENSKVLREATRAGAEVIRDEVDENAPERKGKLKRNIMVASERSIPGTAVAGIRIRGTNASGTNSDITTKAGDKNNAFYWRFIELGTSKMLAHPFVRPAFDAKEVEASQVVIDRLNQAIDEVLAK